MSTLSEPHGAAVVQTPVAAVAIRPARHDRISWGAILAGFVCALSLLAILTLLGFSWGFATIDPTEEVNPFAGLLVGGGIYWVVISIVSLFVGGWIAARVSGLSYLPSTIVHGASVWALVTILTLISSASIVASATRTAADIAGSAVQATVSVAEQAGSGIASLVGPELGQELQQALRQRDLTAEDIRTELRQMYNEVISPQEQQRVGDIATDTAEQILRSPGDFSSDISTGLDRMFGRDAPLSEEDRTELVDAIAERFDLTREEAEQIADRWQARWQEAVERLDVLYEQAVQTATEATEAAAEGISAALFWTAIISLLSLVAAGVGAAVGRPKDAPAES